MTTRRPSPACLLTPALAAVCSPDFLDNDFDWDYVSPDGIHVKDAFTMATKWATHLQRHVVTGTNLLAWEELRTLLPVAPIVEWIKVDIGYCDSEEESLVMAAAARASLMVWRALAACRGYSASGNSGFWRRVFDELYRVEVKDDPCSNASFNRRYVMTDKDRFFDGVLFPRIFLSVSSQFGDESTYHIARVFSGLEDDTSSASERIREELNDALTRLAPHVNVTQVKPVEATISVYVDAANAGQLQAWIAASQVPPRICEDGYDVDAVVGQLAQPSLTVTSLSPRFSASLASTGDTVTDTLAAYQSICIPVVEGMAPGVRYREKSHALRMLFMQYVKWCLCIGDTSPGAGVLKLGFPFHYEPRGMEGICSALPYTRCFKNLALYGLHMANDNQIRGQDLVWLAYALFHPDTASSTWTELEMRGLTYSSITMDADVIIEVMATGNNLLAALGLANETSESYFTATIKAGAVLVAKRLPQPHENEYSTYEEGDREELCDEDNESSDDGGDKSEDANGGDVDELANDGDDDDDDGDEDDEEEKEEEAAKEEDPEIVQVLEANSTMDVCVTSADVTVLGEWVPVVVPGFGLAYVESRYVENIIARPPGRPSLKGLRFCYLRLPYNLIRTLLRLAGGELEHFENNPVSEHEAVYAMHDACPKLQIYRHYTRMSGLCDWRLPPSLRELELMITSADIFRENLEFFLSLQSLETLVIRASNDPVIGDIDAFVLPLLRGPTSLETILLALGSGR